MKTAICTASLIVGAAACAADTGTIVNEWSGVAGDKANMAAFAFRADAGIYPNSVTPLGSLTPVFQLDALTLRRPNDAVTPNFGGGARQTTGADTPVYLDLYSSYDGAAFGGYLGSSSSSVTWNSTVADQPYTFSFSGLTLDSNQKYWFVFSEDDVDGEVSNFRFLVNTSGDNAASGQGKGYLVGDAVQGITQGGAGQDWGTAYTVQFTAIPEPGVLLLGLFGGIALLGTRCGLRRR
ncbi:MAG TPA: hypothetical protein PK640_14070 [Verrucomicrobiota bacterium]|nr:hypothetical protein [Verrucomicrobiota bacterium]